MAWTAEVKNKSLIDGIVNVTVEYSDGSEKIIETYKSPMPDANWIPDTVRNRIAQLEVSSSFDVSIGAITPSDIVTPDANKALFRRRCKMLETVKVMIDLGAIAADNPKVVALISWIKTNANKYFDSLV